MASIPDELLVPEIVFELDELCCDDDGDGDDDEGVGGYCSS